MAGLMTFEKQSKSYGLGFRTGGKLCFFSYSLYWLNRHIGLDELKVERLGDGDWVIFGEMTYKEIEDLVKGGKLIQVHYQLWGVSWSFKGQPQGGDDDFSGYPQWREEMLRICEPGYRKAGGFCQ